MRKIAASLVVLLLTTCAVINASGAEGSNKLADRSIFTETMVEMSWMDLRNEAEKGAIVLLPIAVVEEHGPHMDLSPDIYLTVLHCRIMKQRLEEKGIRTLIAPPYYWGINGTKNFPGSFTVRPETFKAILYDTVESLKSWGFKKIFYVNLHGDGQHRQTILSSAEELRASLGIEVQEVYTLQADVPFPSSPPAREGKFRPDYHAGADETAAVYALFPEKVRTEIVKKLKPQGTFEPLGYVGDPVNFHLEKGIDGLKLDARYDADKIDVFLKKSSKQ